MGLRHQFNTFRNNLHLVSQPECEKCPCQGGGWILSEFDTWHQCPDHYKGHRHPESPEWAIAEVVEVFKIEGGEKIPIYQVQMTIGNELVDESEIYLHFHEFSTAEEAQEFGSSIARRSDISSRVQNTEYWLHLTRTPRPEDLL